MQDEHFRDFVLLCGVGFLSFVSYNLVRTPALAPFAESLGAAPIAVGVIVAASTLTGVCLKLPMGVLSDIVNRRKLMVVGVLAFAFPPFVYPWITNLEVLGVVRVVHGLATAVYTPLVLALVATMYPRQRGASLGWYTSAAQGGAFLAPPLGGWLVDHWGFAHTFNLAGMVGMMTLILFFPIFRSSQEMPQQKPFSPEIWEEFRGSLKLVLQNRPMLAISGSEAAKMMAHGTLMAFLPLYGLSIGLSLAEGGFLFGVQGLISFISKPLMGRVSDQWGRRPLIILGLLMCGGTICAIPHMTQFPLLMILSAGFGFGEAVVTSSSAAFIADLSQGKSLGAGMGLRGTIMDVGHAGGPILAGVLVAMISYTWAFAVIAILQVIAAGLFWGVTRHVPHYQVANPTGG
jgi:MFS family permease